MFSYIVRCNFSDPVKAKPWNDWYSGPKLGQMLSKPYFRSTQRFRRSDGTGRNYLALWILESPEAFNTHEYKSDWGFFEWRPYIIDWSRDLFAGNGLVEDSFAVSPQGALHVVSFDGNGNEMPQRSLRQRFLAARLGPVGSVRRRQLRLVTDARTPHAAHQAETIAADAFHRRLMTIRRTDPCARLDNDGVACDGRHWRLSLVVTMTPQRSSPRRRRPRPPGAGSDQMNWLRVTEPNRCGVWVPAFAGTTLFELQIHRQNKFLTEPSRYQSRQSYALPYVVPVVPPPGFG